ncbi:hypothetical protein [Streptomyces sp. NRRL F-5755]|uniref:hypothetical protein n=1 Tax=Streptomyces sp. NRRL F-5755 TaxID=1519475 RepID=UPI0006ADADE2|nr:hypothetical protein [Streptomyces sp. NRRL F-5755]
MGRACRTGNGHPTDHHRARRDAAGVLPYEQWKQQGLWPGPRPVTRPAVLEEAEKARADYKVDTALGDAVAVVRLFLAEQLGIALEDEATFDRIDEAVRQLLQARGPVGSADLVTVLVSLIAGALAKAAGPGGDPEALFDALIRTQVEAARLLRDIDKHRPPRLTGRAAVPPSSLLRWPIRRACPRTEEAGFIRVGDLVCRGDPAGRRGTVREPARRATCLGVGRGRASPRARGRG